MIELYGGPSPNAVKIILMLEELGLPYRISNVQILDGDQYTPEFMKLNPLAKYPVLIDPDGAGADQPLFESGAILMYLAETYRPELLPAAGPERWETLKWLMVQMAWVGPMLGQNIHFRVQPSEAESYAAGRYRTLAGRIYEVLNGRLADREWLVGDRYTIADIATWPWVTILPNQGFSWADFPALQRWQDRISTRPAAVRTVALQPELIGNSGMMTGNPQAFNRLFLRETGPAVDFSHMAPPAA